MRSFVFCLSVSLLVLCLNLVCSDTVADQKLTLSWNGVLYKVNATPTLSFTPNPLLAGNLGGFTSVPENVTNNLWNYFKQLNANNVRYSPVFYYPRYGSLTVNGTYDITYFKPLLKRFMEAVGNNTVVMNLATLPSIFFHPNVSEVPEDPNAVCWDYVNGEIIMTDLNNVSDYMKDVFDYVLKGEVANKSKLPDKGEPYSVAYWEVLNENEHNIMRDSYKHLYSSIVDHAKETTGIKKPVFVALGGDSPSKIEYILENVNETIQAISLHHRSKSVSHVNVGTYENFFREVDAFLERIDKDVTPLLDAYRHSVSLLVDSIVTLLPKDREMIDPTSNSPRVGSVPIPDMYWMASGASFVYAYLKLAINNRVKSVGMGLFSTHPTIPEWGIKYPMYQSMSMMNWTNGLPTARYWAVKLLIDYIPKGSVLVVDSDNFWEDKTLQYFCARSSSRHGYPPINLSCSTLDNLEILDANHGIISGTCGDFTVTGCRDPSDHSVLDYFRTQCSGQSCVVSFVRLPWDDKCTASLEDIVVRAACGNNPATGSPHMSCADQLFVVPYIVEGKHRVIVVNTRSTGTAFDLGSGLSTSSDYTVITLKSDNDMSTGFEITTVDPSKPIEVPPFSVIVVLLEETL